MAATPSRPSNNQNNCNNYKIEHQELNDSNNNHSVDNSCNSDINVNSDKIENLKKSSCSNCKCTNISIMQLFHEMKQEFPKIPDHVVSQCVLDNCHNRNACIEKLRNETISLIQAYPSQIFMRNNGLKGVPNNCNNRNINNTSENNSNKNNNNCVSNTSDKKKNHSDMSQSPFNKQTTQDYNNVNNNSSIGNITTNNDSNNISGNGVNNHVQRPNTLNFSIEPYNSVSAFLKPVSKPRRAAPLPPTSSLTPSSSSSSSTPTPNQSTPTPPYSSGHLQQQQPPQQINNNHHLHQAPTPLDRLSSQASPSQAKPLSPPPLPDAVVSVNVKVSPVSGRPPVRPRQTTELSFQPQHPFLNRDTPLNSRSYTSVYFNLRPPSDNPQSPINITAGPSLTYLSSGFDARQGHQNQLQITIGDGSGLITARRAQPRNLPVSRSVDDDRGRMIDSNQERIENQYLADEIIQKQLKQKDRLSMELKNNRKHLDSLHREIDALQSPLPPGGCLSLTKEITRLQSVCQKMTQEVEEAGVYVIGETDIAFYNNIYTGQKLTIQNRPGRPPRPPPPTAARSVSQPAVSSGVGFNLPSLVSNNNNNQFRSNNINNSALNSINNNNNNNNLLPNSHNSNNINDNNIHINNNNSEEPWICRTCTFQNHPLLEICEQCEMINLPIDSSNNGGTGMIKITGAHFSPRIENMRLLKSNPQTTNPTTTTSMSNGSTPPMLLIPPSNGTFAPANNLPANNTHSNNNLLNGLMLPN